MVHQRNKAESKKTEFMKNIRKYAIDYKITEPDQPNHNFAEGVICKVRKVRKKWFKGYPISVVGH
jgi:hypothetical protein